MPAFVEAMRCECVLCSHGASLDGELVVVVVDVLAVWLKNANFEVIY